ncbi:MAG: transposase [Pyrinomonadaceae bacterium]|nr:transposase [Pyrinomonadaceae bacterium]
MGTWNDTDRPIAYLITFRTYGTWLPGDARGTIDKRHNIYGGPRADSNIILEQQNAGILKSDAFLMGAKARQAVKNAIREVCVHREWKLYAQCVRINHVHAVTASTASSDKVLLDLKAYSTRSLRKLGLWTYQHSPWVDKGSKRNLWNGDHIFYACDYVINGQGRDLPEFD